MGAYVYPEPMAQTRPAVLAHRGLRRYAPENTLPAFAAAIEVGLSLEMDVYQTSDEGLVVIHEETVDRTTDGAGNVTQMAMADVRKLDAGTMVRSKLYWRKSAGAKGSFPAYSSAATDYGHNRPKYEDYLTPHREEHRGNGRGVQSVRPSLRLRSGGRFKVPLQGRQYEDADRRKAPWMVLR